MSRFETEAMRRTDAGRWCACPRCAALVLLAAALAVTGCPSQPPKQKAVPTRHKAEVISILNSRADLTHTVRARLSVTVKTASMTRAETCQGSLAAEYPDRLRIRGRHDFMDQVPFDIGSDGTTWFVHTHVGDQNEIHLGPTQYLEEYYDPGVPLCARDIVGALGVGRLDEDPPRRELLFTRHPGYYLVTELVTNASGRYVAKRVFVDPDDIVITRMETFRPDGAVDMIAEMTFDTTPSGAPPVPASARIRLLRESALLMELRLQDRQTGVRLPARVFEVPSTEDIPAVYRHESK